MITNESRQRVMKTLGEYGCYFLAVVHLAEEIRGKRIDAVEAFVNALEKKWIDSEATMLDPDAIFAVLTGGKFTLRKTDAAYKPIGNEHEILVFENGTFKHFVLGDGQGNVAYDPLGNSNTVAKGKVTEKRIFRQA